MFFYSGSFKSGNLEFTHEKVNVKGNIWRMMGRELINSIVL